MAIISYVSSNQITPVTGYNYLEELQYGSNGEYFGAPELDAGTGTSRATNRATWESYPDDGIDTGWINASYAIKPGTAGLTLYANGAPGLLKYDVGALPSIGAIKIRTAVQNQAAMLWRSTQVRFYRGGTLQETISLSSFGVDKTAIPGGGIGDTIVSIQPANSDNNRVVVDTQFKMLAPEGVWLDSYDAFSQVFYFAGSGGSGQSLLSSPESLMSGLAGSVDAVLETSVAASGKYTGDVFATAPLSSSNEALNVEIVPDMFGSEDPTLLG